MARGGTDSPVNRELVILASVWLEFGTGMESTTRIGSAARGAKIGYGAAALPNYGKESSHMQRDREKGKKGMACSSPPSEATATCRC